MNIHIGIMVEIMYESGTKMYLFFISKTNDFYMDGVLDMVLKREVERN
jgi:hypothetical protein